MELTKKDNVILEHLFHDGRTSSKELARIANMKQPSAYNRIKKLEQEGFINKYDGVINRNVLPLIMKIYYCNLTQNEENEMIEHENCEVLQRTFGIFSHQIMCFFKTKKQVKEFEKLIPKKKLEYNIDKSERLGGSIFDIKRKIDKYPKEEKILKLTHADVLIIKTILNGGARKTAVDIANETGLSVEIVKYRKKRLTDNGYFLLFIAQPGQAFKSVKAVYHIFELEKPIDMDKIKGLPRQVIAYYDNNHIQVIQLSFSFNDYLGNSKKLFEIMEPHTSRLHSFPIDKSIVLNKFSEELLTS